MRQALALAATVEGSTSPNPRVGCLLVREGRVVGTGVHRGAGQSHAEALAVSAAGDEARGSTAYVNLEPCAHEGLTPPCANLLIDSGVARVVASIVDPDPRVDGRGFARLREAGIKVDIGAGSDAAKRINEPFLHWHRHGRPYVTLKAAISLDGMLSGADGAARWITSSASRRFAHRLRLRNDAILIGAQTARRDRPRLSVRLPGVEATPLRVVISRSLELDPGSAPFDDGKGPVVVFTHENAPGPARAALGDSIEVITVPAVGEGLALGEILAHLGRRGVRSLLVEGGGKTFRSFLEAGLADVGAIFVAGCFLGAVGGTPLAHGPAVSVPSMAWSLRVRNIVPLERDCLWLGEFAAPPTAA